MKTRSIAISSLTALCLATFGLGIFTSPGIAQGGKVDREKGTAVMQSCAKICTDCQRACDACVSHCAHMLQKGNKQHLTTLATCQDCATTCSAAAQIVARGGPFSKAICTACADACVLCAKECAQFPDDDQMKSCADECRICEQACRVMLAQEVAE